MSHSLESLHTLCFHLPNVLPNPMFTAKYIVMFCRSFEVVHLLFLEMGCEHACYLYLPVEGTSHFLTSCRNILLPVGFSVQLEETFPSIYIILLPYVSCLYSSEDPNEDISSLLAKYSSNPESEPQLKLLLPLIASSFGGNKSVNETIQELKKHQLSTDATGDVLNARCLPNICEGFFFLFSISYFYI